METTTNVLKQMQGLARLSLDFAEAWPLPEKLPGETSRRAPVSAPKLEGLPWRDTGDVLSLLGTVGTK